MNARPLIHRLALAVSVSLLAACAQKGPGPLYMWESFPRQQYDTLLKEGAAPDQIVAMEAHAEKARASGAALPPGFRAHWGMLMLSVGDVDSARRLWASEKQAFPESSAYIDQMLKRLDATTTTAKNENPA